MRKTRDVTLTVQLPEDLADQAEELAKVDPDFLSRIVLYGLTRRAIYRHIRTTLAGAFAVILLAGCGILEPVEDVRYVGLRPLEPVPAAYRAWYAATEECLGMRGELDRVRWSVADSIVYWDEQLGDWWTARGTVRDRHTIVVRVDHLTDSRVVRHEAEHEITGLGNEIHLPVHGTRCDGFTERGGQHHARP